DEPAGDDEREGAGEPARIVERAEHRLVRHLAVHGLERRRLLGARDPVHHARPVGLGVELHRLDAARDLHREERPALRYAVAALAREELAAERAEARLVEIDRLP